MDKLKEEYENLYWHCMNNSLNPDKMWKFILKAIKSAKEEDRKDKFPETPSKGYAKSIGKWYVSVDEKNKRIYFWDGNTNQINFLYDFKI